MGTPFINIDNLITFNANGDVLVERDALKASPNRVFGAIQLAYSHMNDGPLVEACSGGSGPLSSYCELSFEAYLSLLEQIEINESTRKAKRTHIKVRRSEFSTSRSQLILAMIDAGVPHICAYPECDTTADLTLDHIVPLSRGGTDELSNLQFLCRSHNSAKGDQVGV